MNDNNGFIVIHRKILEWEWYKDINTKTLFIHCLLKANWKDSKFEGILVPRGSFVTSLQSLSDELSNKKQNFTIKNVRTSLKHLEETGEVASKSYPKFRIITIKNYDLYQGCDKANGKQVASNGQATGKQVATIEQSNKVTKKQISSSSSSANLLNYVEESFGRTLTSIESEEILSWEDNELTRYAIRLSVLNGAIKGVLNSWKLKNIKTVQDAQREEESFKKAKNKQNFKYNEPVPKWIDEEIEKKTLTDNERNEMEDLLKEFQ